MAENRRLNQENKTKQKRNPKTKQQNPKQIQKTDDKQGKYICSSYYRGISSLIYKQLPQINKRGRNRKTHKGYEQACHRKCKRLLTFEKPVHNLYQSVWKKIEIIQFSQAGKKEMFFEDTVGEILKKHSFLYIVRRTPSRGGLWAVPVSIRNVYTFEPSNSTLRDPASPYTHKRNDKCKMSFTAH